MIEGANRESRRDGAGDGEAEDIRGAGARRRRLLPYRWRRYPSLPNPNYVIVCSRRFERVEDPSIWYFFSRFIVLDLVCCSMSVLDVYFESSSV